MGICFIDQEPEPDQDQYHALYLMPSLTSWRTSTYIQKNCFARETIHIKFIYGLTKIRSEKTLSTTPLEHLIKCSQDSVILKSHILSL